MKRVLLFLAMILTTSAAWLASAQQVGSVQTSTAENPKWYVFAAISRGGCLTIDGGTLKHVVQTPQSAWRFEDAGDGGYFVINANGQYLSAPASVSNTPTVTYLVNNGLVFGKNPNSVKFSLSSNADGSGYTCIDASNAGPGVSGGWIKNDGGTNWLISEYAAVEPVASTADAPVWFQFACYNRLGYLTANPNELPSHVDLSAYSLWRFTATAEDGKYYVQNVEGNYLTATGASSEPAEIEVVRNGVNNIGFRLGVGGTNIDADNYDDFCHTWFPSNGDWNGTTWILQESDFGTLVDLGNKMAALPALFDITDIQDVLNAYKANPTDVDAINGLLDAKDQIYAAWSTANGKVVTFNNQGRSGNYQWLGVNGQNKLYGTTDKTLANLWTLTMSGDGTMTFHNEYTGQYMGADLPDVNVPISSSNTPAPFALLLGTNTNEIRLQPIAWQVTAPDWSYHLAGGGAIVKWYANSVENQWLVDVVSDETQAEMWTAAISGLKTGAAIYSLSESPILFPTEQVNTIKNAISNVNIAKTETNKWVDVYRQTQAAISNIYTQNAFAPVNVTLQTKAASGKYLTVNGSAFEETEAVNAFGVWQLKQLPGQLAFEVYAPASDAYLPSFTTGGAAVAPTSYANAGVFFVDHKSQYGTGANYQNFDHNSIRLSCNGLFLNNNGKLQSVVGNGAFSWWQVATVSVDDIKDSAEAALGSAKPDATAATETLGLLGIFSNEQIAAITSSINGYNPTIETVEDALAVAGNTALKEMVNEQITRPFLMQNARRAAAGNKPSYLGHIGNNILNSWYVPNVDAQWYVSYVGNGAFNLYTLPYGSKSAAPAPLYVNNSFKLTSNQLEAAAYQLVANPNYEGSVAFKFTNGTNNGLNMDSGVSQLTSWGYDDGGSAWITVAPDATVPAGGDGKYYVLASLGRGNALAPVLTNSLAGDPVARAQAETYNETNGYGTFSNGSTIWTAEPVEGTDGFALKNYVNKLYLGHDFNLTGEQYVWHVLPNGINALGNAISNEATINGYSCIDAANYNETAIGYYMPYSTDWNGTTWCITALPNALVSTYDAASDAEVANQLSMMEAAVNGFYAVPSVWSTAELDAAKAVITSETAGLHAKANAFAAIAKKADGVVMTIANAMINANINGISSPLANASSKATGALLNFVTNGENQNIRATFTGGKNVLWQLSYAGRGGYYFGNIDGNLWIKNNGASQALSGVAKADATPYYFLNKNDLDPNYGSSVVALSSNLLVPGTGTCMHLNTTSNANSNVLTWGPNAAGSSQWILSRVDDVNIDTDALYIINAYSRGGMISPTNAYNMSNNVSELQGKRENLVGLAGWQFQRVHPEHPTDRSYRLYNPGLNAFLSHSYTLTEDHSYLWFLLPNGINGNGLVLSKTPEVAANTCIDAANNNSLGNWNPRANDWEGTCWILNKTTDKAIGLNTVPELQTAAVKSNAKAARETFTGYAAPFTLGKSYFEGYAQQAAMFENFSMTEGTLSQVNYKDNMTQAVLDYNWLTRDFTTANFPYWFATEINTDTYYVIKSIRRGNNANAQVNGTAYLGVVDGKPATVSQDDAVSKSENHWKLVPTTGDQFVIVNANGDYLTFSSAFGLSEVAEDAVELTGEAVLSGVPGTSLKMVGSTFGMNVDQQAGSRPLVHYGWTDGGSTWQITTVSHSGIQEVGSDDCDVDINAADAEIYTIQGARISAQSIKAGLYIVRQGGNTAKVCVK